MRETDIEWCDSTVNPTSNCDGCELWMPNKGVRKCYAGTFTEKMQGIGAFDRPIGLHPDRMAEAPYWPDFRGIKRPRKPWLGTMPRVIFVGDMSDIFSKAVTFEYLWESVFCPMRSDAGLQHIWIVLTKRPSRAKEFATWMLSTKGVHWPAHVWAMTSVTSQRTADSRIAEIYATGARVIGVSAEPILSGFKLGKNAGFLNWVIVGGESGKGEPTVTNVEDVFSLQDECQAAGVPVFIKQLGARPRLNGMPLNLMHPKGGSWEEWKGDLERLRVRQMPCPIEVKPPQPELL